MTTLWTEMGQGPCYPQHKACAPSCSWKRDSRASPPRTRFKDS